MRLPTIESIKLSDWDADTLSKWSELTEKVRENSSGTQTDKFKKRVREIKAWQYSGFSVTDFYPYLEERLTIRALTWLWLENHEVREDLLLKRVLEQMQKSQPWLGRLVTIQLIALYLRFYDELETEFSTKKPGILSDLKEIIKKQLTLLNNRSVKKEQQTQTLFTSFIKYEDILLSDNAVNDVVDLATSKQLDLYEVFQKLGLKGFDAGRFAQRCRYLFYIRTVEDLVEGQWDTVLDELRRIEVAEVPYDESGLLGHQVMRLLIDKVETEPTQQWLDFLLDIAGDPRVSSQSALFRKWWQLLGTDRINRVRSWLAKEDLRLFLQAVEQYGIESNDVDLQRMFPARKVFLEGLFDQGLVRNARLMLGNRAAEYVLRALESDIRTNYISLRGMADKAVIYLDCGEFYLIEGSHSFKLWIYLAKPTEKFNSYETDQTLDLHGVTRDVVSQYKNAHPLLPYADIVHHQNTWVNRAITFLFDNGVYVDIESLMSSTDYSDYLARFGMPILQSNNQIKTQKTNPWQQLL